MRSTSAIVLLFYLACAPSVPPVPPDPDFVELPPGTFEMGCDNGGDFTGCYVHPNEGPVSQVRLTHGFYLQKHEVTQIQFQNLTDERPALFAECGEDCPVENVTWSEAALYANWKSRELELQECYDCFDIRREVFCEPQGNPYECEGYRLPTEAEWEYAARRGPDVVAGGAQTSYTVAWFSENSNGTSHPVMVKEPNSSGLHDMSGNVGECERVDPTGVPSGDARSIRGGGWNSRWSSIRTTSRSRLGPEERDSQVGFRLARTIPEE